MLPVHAAQYLVNRFGSIPGGITPLKLQKLLYYVKAWSVVQPWGPSGEQGKIVDGPFMRWPHGPVNRAVYDHFKAHGRQALQPVSLGQYEPKGPMRDFIDFVGASYVRFPAMTLSVMTHREDPWRLTPDGSVISVARLQTYYEKQPFAQNLPFDSGKPYVSVPSDIGKAFTMDLSDADEARAITHASFSAYMVQVERLLEMGLRDDGHVSRLMA